MCPVNAIAWPARLGRTFELAVVSLDDGVQERRMKAASSILSLVVAASALNAPAAAIIAPRPLHHDPVFDGGADD